MTALGFSGTEPASGPFPHWTLAALRAWQAITLGQWAWTTGIALVVGLAAVVGVLPGILDIVPTVIGENGVSSSQARSLGVAISFVSGGYCLLLAIRIAEYGAWRGLPPLRRYVAAGIGACAVAMLIEITLYVLVPSLAPKAGGWRLLLDSNQLLGRMAWSVADLGLTGGLALAVYVRLRSARLAREAFNTAELERVAAGREVLASRLAVMQAQIEPTFLLGTLEQVEALYDRDAQSADRMLDSLIAYLRAALPQLRSERSTLAREVQLADSYLRIVQLRMGSRLHYHVDVPPELGSCDFPPMLLLPLIDDALRNGLEPLAHGGTIVVTAGADGDRLRVCVSDDGLPRTAAAPERTIIAMLDERLRGLYGALARLELIANGPKGTLVSIGVPLDTTCHYR